MIVRSDVPAMQLAQPQRARWLAGVVASAMIGLSACSASSKAAAPASAPAVSSPASGQPTTTADTSAASPADSSSAAVDSPSAVGGGALGAVDACTLLTAADFAAATDKVQPADLPPSAYSLRTVKAVTDVSANVDQHSACTYHFSGKPGASGELTLDVMTAAEYHSLGQLETGKPIDGLGDEAAVFGERPAFLKGPRGVEIANSSSTIAFGKALLRALAAHF